jgi:phospholipid/cholesterol/gamma-HCH transport system substrate-binding protein
VIAQRVAALAFLTAVVAVVIIVVSPGGSSYTVRMRLSDADGLRQGSPVAIGGQDVGTISMHVRGNAVLVDMKIDKAQAPVGRDATASIAAVNLLGQKRIELFKGNVGEPAPSGYLLPASQVKVTTDLDQVLDVLTPDVRARLAILINAAGQAFTGRRADFSQTLQQLPSDLQAGYQLLGGISADNHTLADLVQTSDGFVGQLTAKRTQLVSTVHVLGQASATFAARRAQLGATLARAPGTLATLQIFLGKLQATTVPLGPAARDISATAPALTQTLAQLDPFRKAADPTLTLATHVAPELTQLAAGATPVVARATPVVAQLASFSTALTPISTIINKSFDNLVAILQNWSRAIQFRDGLSHVFRGEATITPQVVESMLNQLQQAGVLGSLQTAASEMRRSSAATPAYAPSSPSGGGAPARAGSSPPRAGSSGKAAAGAPGAAPTSPGSSGSGSGGSLGSLLSYLLGR